jgi:alginate O-acetyltransferase complex protein AlgI
MSEMPNFKKSSSIHPVRLLQFIVLLFQLGLIWYIVRRFDIEPNFGVKEFFPIIIIGFTVNFFLKEALRPTFLSFLTFVACFILFQPFVAIKIILLSLAVFGIMILPIKRLIRVLILVIVALFLAIVRLHLIELADIEIVLPVVASIFMFRSIIFLHELKFINEKVSIWKQMSYFFMLPNLIFPLYPLVDYKTYLNTYYNKDDLKIYRNGIRLLIVGVLHLMIYRIIYIHLLPDPTTLTGYSDTVQYLVFSYMMILRMSGMFHFILGILALFGMNLPPIFNLYFLTNSFNDLWRRINVYWKDFMMKVFYYPIYFKVKKFGMGTAIFLTTMIIFIITWFFHAWQWFWIRGKFSLSLTDILFWIIFGLLIALNSLYQQKREKKFIREGFSYLKALTLTMRTIGMFVFMSFFWTFWNSTTILEWTEIVFQLIVISFKEVLITCLILIIIMFIGVFAQLLHAKYGFENVRKFLRFQHFFSLNALIFTFVIIAFPPFQDFLKSKTQFNLRDYLEMKLNMHDDRIVEKGYYETLLNKESALSPLWEIQKKENTRQYRKNAAPEEESRKMTKSTKDIRRKVLYPNNKVKFKDKWVETNEWGMRDKSYELIAPINHYRMAIIGGSFEFGSGVSNEDVYEKIAEDSINNMQIPKGYEEYEILNFSVNAYTLIQYLKVVEDQIVLFKPDVLMIAVHPGVLNRTIDRGISSLVTREIDLEYPFLKSIIAKAGITSKISEREVLKKLIPYKEYISDSCLHFISKICDENNIIPSIIFLEPFGNKEHEFLSTISKKYGFIILDLQYPYKQFPDRVIRVGLTDRHPNKLGHQLIGEKLVEQLILHNKDLKLNLNLNP